VASGYHTRQRETQRDRILRLLLSAKGQWVPLWQIVPLAAQYSARLHELRHHDGYLIENKTEIDPKSGQRHSWFRIPTTPDEPTPPPAPPQSESPFQRSHAKDLEREAPLFTGRVR
jgi:hypothetical protein